MESLISHGVIPASKVLRCVEMHVTGEPARIVYHGYPHLSGTLLEQREQALREHDDYRKRLLLEPRGHKDMYGAIIRRDTELIRSGDAHIGVLFCHSYGYSPMCGHATIALARFLVDTQDTSIFPNRHKLTVDENEKAVHIKLHAPCGVVAVIVPVTDDSRCDQSRPIRFLSTPAYPVCLGLEVPIPAHCRWPQLGERSSVVLDIGYGGAYFLVIDLKELGFGAGLKGTSLDDAVSCVKKIGDAFGSNEAIIHQSGMPAHMARVAYYAVLLEDPSTGVRPAGILETGSGMCIFGDGQVDRSPTGSGTSARMALAYARGARGVGQTCAYNSLTSNHFESGAFTATIVKEVPWNGPNGFDKAVVVEVGGQAFYTGFSTYFVEDGDKIGDSGFLFKEFTAKKPS
ncbi:hypothetical protein B0J15DRAFT_496565 [Fusarium solani]|uniref:trans-L-3-hydroxyproline dehydratase n=1 Tax=Fusarium solani TaxID=169388 RepID=A0A9P9K5Y7_FUSSL|nr:uncharacterized protein B0J15DRAFT_496565 [Fusarium solani]KAH7250632.1 hypothetical protein B0J15DRAFT_496565 [Fusarium solani]